MVTNGDKWSNLTIQLGRYVVLNAIVLVFQFSAHFWNPCIDQIWNLAQIVVNFCGHHALSSCSHETVKFIIIFAKSKSRNPLWVLPCGDTWHHNKRVTLDRKKTNGFKKQRKEKPLLFSVVFCQERFWGSIMIKNILCILP